MALCPSPKVLLYSPILNPHSSSSFQGFKTNAADSLPQRISYIIARYAGHFTKETSSCSIDFHELWAQPTIPAPHSSLPPSVTRLHSVGSFQSSTKFPLVINHLKLLSKVFNLSFCLWPCIPLLYRDILKNWHHKSKQTSGIEYWKVKKMESLSEIESPSNSYF